MFPTIGILGGGQLGKMLCLAAGPMHLKTWIMDVNSEVPAAPYCHQFVSGDIRNLEDVLAFGQQVDIITIEIENVNIEALRLLKAQGKKVYPDPETLALIQDKGLQKKWYQKNGFATAPFRLYNSEIEIAKALKKGTEQYPLVQKLRTGGYDGRGVQILKGPEDLPQLLVGPSVIENLIPIQTELAVMVARNASGDAQVFDAVSMQFHPSANLVEMVVCPAEVSAQIASDALELALELAQKLKIVGLLAVEMFVDEAGQLLINEIAPRPHNSAHHTIEACVTSQFEQHLRAILDWPLGQTRLRTHAATINLLGAAQHSGPAEFKNLSYCQSLGGVHLHLYGKQETRPFRKMGHCTVIGASSEEVKRLATMVKETLQIVSSVGTD